MSNFDLWRLERATVGFKMLGYNGPRPDSQSLGDWRCSGRIARQYRVSGTASYSPSSLLVVFLRSTIVMVDKNGTTAARNQPGLRDPWSISKLQDLALISVGRRNSPARPFFLVVLSLALSFFGQSLSFVFPCCLATTSSPSFNIASDPTSHCLPHSSHSFHFRGVILLCKV